MTSAARRLTVNASPNWERIHVLLPVPRGPKRKKDDRGVFRRRVYIDTNFTVKMVSTYTGHHSRRNCGAPGAEAERAEDYGETAHDVRGHTDDQRPLTDADSVDEVNQLSAE